MGVGRWMFQKMMRDKGVTPLADLRQMAIDLGVTLLACQMSMDVMGIKRGSDRRGGRCCRRRDLLQPCSGGQDHVHLVSAPV